MRTRYVSFAGNAVAIDHAGDDQRDLLEYLFGDLDDTEVDEPLSRFRITRDTSTGNTCVDQEGERIFTGTDRATLARTLVEKALYTLVESDRTGLALHAAAVAAGARGILIPGQSGAGKSTLALWLTSRGFSYLTDELVHIPLDSNRIEAFTRPINLKRNGSDLIAGELALKDDDERILRTAHLSIVPHRLLNPSHKRIRPEIRAIVFPQLAKNRAPHRLEPLSKGQAGLKLVECLVNGRNIPSHGINQLSRIVREVPAYGLHYSGFRTLPDLLGDILDWPATEDPPSELHRQDAAV